MATYKPVEYVIFDMDGLLLSSFAPILKKALDTFWPSASTNSVSTLFRIDTEKIYFDTFKQVLSKYNVTYTEEMKLKVMGTVPRDTYSIFIREYNLSCTLDTLSEEMMSALLVNMTQAELMLGK